MGVLSLCAVAMLCLALGRALTRSTAAAAEAAAPADAMPLPAGSPPESTGSEPDAHGLSREQALALVRRRYAARVLRAEEIERNGSRLYVFRLLSSNGTVWTVRIDARSGAEVP